MVVTRTRRPVLGVIGMIIGLFLAMPTMIVIPMSFTGGQTFTFPPQTWSLRWYKSFADAAAWRSALLTSIEVALLVTLLSVAIGMPTAFGLRLLSRRLTGLAQAIILFPLIVPTIVTAVAIYEVFLQWHLSGTIAGFVFAHTVIALPFVVVTLATGMGRLDVRLLRAAATMGSRSTYTFRRVTVPLMLPSVLVAAVLAFASSLDEVVIALFLSTSTMTTLPVQMYNSMIQQTDPTIAAASSILVTLVTAILLAFALGRLRFARREATDG